MESKHVKSGSMSLVIGEVREKVEERHQEKSKERYTPKPHIVHTDPAVQNRQGHKPQVPAHPAGGYTDTQVPRKAV